MASKRTNHRPWLFPIEVAEFVHARNLAAAILIKIFLFTLLSCSYSGLKNPGSGVSWLPTYSHPVKGRITTQFNLFHDGIDFAAPRGTPVRAAASGVVKFRGYIRGYGKTVILPHDNNITTLYAHLHTFRTSKNRKVDRGQIIGTVGSTGRSTGPHLHFETRVKNKPRDPNQFLPF